MQLVIRHSLAWMGSVAAFGLGLFGWLVLASAQPPASVGIRAPEGFWVTLAADDALAHDITSMTLNADGDPLVSGPGYIKTLLDEDGDGEFDRGVTFADLPKGGAHGLLVIGDQLLVTGDNRLLLFRDTDGDRVADGPPQTIASLKTVDHGGNGIAQRPDGWIYVICGNDAGVTTEHITTERSPIREPKQGVVLRFSPDLKQSEVLAHGFRNPYDLAFNEHGRIFTVDADGERDQYLPWYTPTRLMEIGQGRHHGWMLPGWTRSWNRPAYFPETAERIVEVGRGSPTGVVVYRHRQFPADYRGSVMSCCWTLGRVYHFPLGRRGSSYASHREIFLETTGEVGFAPVDLVVEPGGTLLVAIGGRGTRGGLFRVQYVGDGERGPASPVAAGDDLQKVLSAPQPLAAWSRRHWEPLAKKLGAAPFVAAMKDGMLPPEQRSRAIEVLTERFGGLPAADARLAIPTADPETLSRIAWSLGRKEQGEEGAKLLAELTPHDDVRVRRSAWESLATLERFSQVATSVHWRDITERYDRRVRRAALVAARRLPPEVKQQVLPSGGSVEERLARLWVNPAVGLAAFREALGVYASATSDEQRLGSLRLMELALGDIRTAPSEPEVYAGYAAVDADLAAEMAREPELAKMVSLLPECPPDLRGETARLLGMLSAPTPGLIEAIAQQWTADSRLEDDLHYLIVLSRLPGPRSAEVTRRTATALVRLHPKMAAGRMYASRNWPQRVGEAIAELCQRDPNLPAAIVARPEFGQPGHSLLAAQFSGEIELTAARKLLAETRKSDDAERWSSDLIAVIGRLPAAESLPALREAWNDLGARDSIVPLLARDPQSEDRPRLVESLSAAQPQTVETAAVALLQLNEKASPAEITAAMRTLRQYCTAPQFAPVREKLARLLNHWTAANIAVPEVRGANPLEAYEPWFAWFSRKYPEQQAELAGLTGENAEFWQRRLAALSWEQGDVTRGEKVYQRRSCSRCHAGRSRLGPDLAGAAGRFSREDLFAAILDPNRDVSPLYQTTQIVTSSGKIYQGLLIYESPEGTLMQTGPDTTTRIAGQEIVLMRKDRQSLMPAGLLREATDQELVDLYAYLRTLRGEQ